MRPWFVLRQNPLLSGPSYPRLAPIPLRWCEPIHGVGQVALIGHRCGAEDFRLVPGGSRFNLVHCEAVITPGHAELPSTFASSGQRTVGSTVAA
jgi:hypothetical protein